MCDDQQFITYQPLFLGCLSKVWNLIILRLTLFGFIIIWLSLSILVFLLQFFLQQLVRVNVFGVFACDCVRLFVFWTKYFPCEHISQWLRSNNFDERANIIYLIENSIFRIYTRYALILFRKICLTDVCWSLPPPFSSISPLFHNHFYCRFFWLCPFILNDLV